jgi:hypothetical protein
LILFHFQVTSNETKKNIKRRDKSKVNNIERSVKERERKPGKIRA